MERVRTIDIAAHAGRRVRVLGWLHALRLLGGVSFLVVRDGWGMVQVVTEDAADLAPLHEADAGPETVLAVEGEVVAMPQAPGGFELQRPTIRSSCRCEGDARAPQQAEPARFAPHAARPRVVANRHPARRACVPPGRGGHGRFRATLKAARLYRDPDTQDCGLGH